MIEFKNKSRTEAILENMLGATNTLKPPQSRVEALLMELLELIEDISHGSGTVFRFLGEKEYVDELPETGNEQGDVWFVKEKMAGFIWIVREDYPDGYWEELGEVIDTASLENVFFPVQYNVTSLSDIAGAIQSNKVPVLIFYPETAGSKTRYAYFGYYDFTGACFYEFSSDNEVIEYFIKTKHGWQSPRTISLVNSVNGQTGDVTLTADDVDIYRVVYTADLDTQTATCNKTANEIFTAMQSGKDVEAALVDATSGYTIAHLSSVLFGGTTLVWGALSPSDLYMLFHTIADNSISIRTIGLVNSVNGSMGDVTLTAYDVGAVANPNEVTVSDSGAVSRVCEGNTIYTFNGDLTSLTLTQIGTPEYVVIFYTGSTAPTVTFPSGVVFPDTLTIEANKRYEVSVRSGYAVVQSWSVSA